MTVTDTFRISVFLAALAVLVPVSSISAEMFTWTDEKGVVHFSDKEPEGVSANPVGKPPEEANRGIRKSWEEEFREICDSGNDLSGRSRAILEFYLDDLGDIRTEMEGSGRSDEFKEGMRASLNECSSRVTKALGAARSREMSKEQELARIAKEEEAFGRLQKVVAERLEERRRSGAAYRREGLRFYSDLKPMSAPLKYGMSADEVRASWKEPLRTWKTGDPSGTTEWWSYPMNIQLQFTNGKLTRWTVNY